MITPRPRDIDTAWRNLLAILAGPLPLAVEKQKKAAISHQHSA